MHVEQHAGVDIAALDPRLVGAVGAHRLLGHCTLGHCMLEPSQAGEGQPSEKALDSHCRGQPLRHSFILECWVIDAVYARRRAAGARPLPPLGAPGSSPCQRPDVPFISRCRAGCRACAAPAQLCRLASGLRLRPCGAADRADPHGACRRRRSNSSRCSREAADAAPRRIGIAGREVRAPPHSSDSWSRWRQRARGWRGAPEHRPWRVWSAVTSSAPQSHQANFMSSPPDLPSYRLKRNSRAKRLTRPPKECRPPGISSSSTPGAHAAGRPRAPARIPPYLAREPGRRRRAAPHRFQ